MSRMIDADKAMRLLIEKMPSGMKKSIVSIMNKVPTIEPRCEVCEAFNKTRLLIPQPQRTGRCIWCDGIEDKRLRIEFYWIDDDGNTASFSEPHMVATGIAKYCPECGRKLKMEVEHEEVL